MSCSWNRKKRNKKVNRNPVFWVKLMWPYFNCYWSVVIMSRSADVARSSLSGKNIYDHEFRFRSRELTYVDPIHSRHHCSHEPQSGVLSWPDPACGRRADYNLLDTTRMFKFARERRGEEGCKIKYEYFSNGALCVFNDAVSTALVR